MFSRNITHSLLRCHVRSHGCRFKRTSAWHPIRLLPMAVRSMTTLRSASATRWWSRQRPKNTSPSTCMTSRPAPIPVDTLRHLCLTDLARSGWELHAIATFAGHRSLSTTLQYIHLSGRDLAGKLARGMAQIHSWRAQMLAESSAQRGDAP